MDPMATRVCGLSVLSDASTIYQAADAAKVSAREVADSFGVGIGSVYNVIVANSYSFCGNFSMRRLSIYGFNLKNTLT